MAEHNSAVRKGKKLAKTLGPGWKPVIWENMGWHFRALKGDMDVHDHGNSAWASLRSDNLLYNQVCASALRPSDAVKKVLRDARRIAKALQRACEEVES